MTPLSAWENFYVIIGSSAGALIAVRRPDTYCQQAHWSRYGAGRPCVCDADYLHFGAVLLLAGILSAPWQEIAPAAVLWGLLGLCGIVYAAVVTRRMRQQAAYKPVFEDWLFHVLLPLAAYVTLAAAAFAAGSYLREALFGIGTAEAVPGHLFRFRTHLFGKPVS